MGDEKKKYQKVEEVYADRAAFDFEKLLDPYREGGQVAAPVERKLGLIIDWLINKKRYPVEVVGASILIVFWEMFNGKEFAGDGTYGSKGRELDLYLRTTCDKLLQQKLQEKVFASIAGGRMAMVSEFIKREVELKTYPRIKKIFGRKKWKAKQAEYLQMVETADHEPA